MITWVRHGQSTSNAGGISSNTDTVEITELGHKQALSFSQSVQEAPDLIIHSPFLRAYQTASYLIQRYPEVPVVMRNIQEFNYLDKRRCVNTDYKQRSEIAKFFWEKNDPHYQDCPEVESFYQCVNRVADEMDYMKNLTEKNIYVFSHQHIMAIVRMIMQQQLTREPTPEMMRAFRKQSFIDNCQTIKIEYALDDFLQLEEKFKKNKEIEKDKLKFS